MEGPQENNKDPIHSNLSKFFMRFYLD